MVQPTLTEPAKMPLRPGSKINKSLRILIASNTTLIFVLGLFGPFYAVFIQRIGGTIAMAGLSWAVFGIVTGTLTLFFSRYGLKVKEQELLISLGYALRSVTFLSYAFMDNLPQLILTQVVWGLSVAIGTPAFDSVFSSHTDKQDGIAQWAAWEGLSSIASGLAALVGGIMIQNFGFRPVFITMSLVTLYLAVYIYRLPRTVL